MKIGEARKLIEAFTWLKICSDEGTIKIYINKDYGILKKNDLIVIDSVYLNKYRSGVIVKGKIGDHQFLNTSTQFIKILKMSRVEGDLPKQNN